MGRGKGSGNGAKSKGKGKSDETRGRVRVIGVESSGEESVDEGSGIKGQGAKTHVYAPVRMICGGL